MSTTQHTVLQLLNKTSQQTMKCQWYGHQGPRSRYCILVALDDRTTDTSLSVAYVCKFASETFISETLQLN